VHDFSIPVFGSHLGIAARHGKVRDFAAQEISARQGRGATGSAKSDILDKLNKVHQQKPAEMNEAAVLSMATSNIFAGSDTTAISLRSVIYHLCRSPPSKAKLVAELDSAYARGELSFPIALAQANKLPYLQAVMQEGLRMHPAVGMTLPRVTPDGGITIAGTFIPQGTVVGVNPWVLHRDKGIFGEDADVFRPERWLEQGEGEKARSRGDMERFFFAFGAGARVCLGRNLSLMEMGKLIPTLFLSFDVELVDGQAALKETCWWFVKQEGLLVRLTRRGAR
jgi:cytochrome P450